jgi:branched-chain amino acid transport system substrate-binding protein
MKLLTTLLLISILWISQISVAREIHLGLASNFSDLSLSTSNPYGDYFRKAVQLALKDSQAKLNKKNIKIIFDEFDYGTNQLRVLEAAKKAVKSPVIAVLGYGLSPEALLAAPIHHAEGLPMITPSATANRLSDIGKYIHMVAFDNNFMGQSLAKVAKSRLQSKKMAIVVADDCAYCHNLADSFEREFKSLGGDIVVRVGVLDSQHDFTHVINELKEKEIDAILVPNYEFPSVRIIASLLQQGIKKPFLGGDGWGDTGEEFYKVLSGKQLQGYSISHWHPDLKTKASIKFKKDFEAMSGKEPNDTAVLAYDSMNLFIEALLKTTDYTRDGIETALNHIHRFEGVTGTFLYRSDNKAPEKSVVLLKTGTKRFEVLSTLNPESKGGDK